MIRRKTTHSSDRKKSSNLAARFDEIHKKVQPVRRLPMIISALFYGRSGTGKTTLACTFPGPLLILDFQERGTDSVYDVPNLDKIDILTWDEVEPVYWMLKKERSYKTVILDQVSSMQDLCQQKVLEEEKKEQMSQRLFGEVSNRMKTWVLNYRNLIDEGMNVVFLSHDRVSTRDADDDDQIDPSIGPRLMPSVAGTLNGAVKVIGNTFIRETFGPRDPKTKTRPHSVDYCLRTGPHSVYATKIRTPKKIKPPELIVDPTYEKIVIAMRQGDVESLNSGTPFLRRKLK